MVCDPCHRMDELREGLRSELDGKRGMLAHIVEGGEIALGDEIELARRVAIRSPVKAAGRRRSCPLRLGTAASRTSRTAPRPRACLVEQAQPLGRARASGGRMSSPSPLSGRRARASAYPSSQTARSKMPGSRSSQRSWVSSMSSRLGANTSNTKRPLRLQERPRSAKRSKLLGLGLHVQEGAEGADDEGHALGDRGLAKVPDAEIEQIARACRSPPPRGQPPASRARSRHR